MSKMIKLELNQEELKAMSQEEAELAKRWLRETERSFNELVDHDKMYQLALEATLMGTFVTEEQIRSCIRSKEVE